MPTAESVLTIIAGILALLNAFMVFVLRGVRSEMSTLKAELAAQLGQLGQKIDLHVLERVTRLEGENKDLQTWRRQVDHTLAQTERRRDDRHDRQGT